MSTQECTIAGAKQEEKHGEALYWAVLLIWAGIVFGAESLEVLPRIGQADAWNWVFFGAGALQLIGCLRRAASPDRVHPSAWDYVWGGILLIIGLGGLTPVEIGFPLILLLIGMTLLITTLNTPKHSTL